MRRHRRALGFLCGLAACAATGWASPCPAATKGALTAQADKPHAAVAYRPDLELVTQDNKTVHFYDDLIAGRIALINFMFTTCTSICPPMTANLAQVQRLLKEYLGDRVVMMGTRPGRVTRDLAVKLARPREANDRDVTTLAAVIERELKIEIEKVIREELDDAWTPAGGGLPDAPGRDVGGGI